MSVERDISTWIDGWAMFSPTRTAIHYEGETISYADLADRIGRMAAFLRDIGIGAGDRVAHLGYNAPENIILLFACARLGAVMVPLNWRLAVPEHLFMIKDAGAKAVFAESDFHDNALAAHDALKDLTLVDQTGGAGKPWIDMNAALAKQDPLPSGRTETFDDPLKIVYTSGTTGRPKGAVITQGNLFWNTVNSQVVHDFASTDHILTTLPLFHVGGMNIQTLPILHAGAEMTLHRKFDPKATLDLLASGAINKTLLVPAQLQAIIALPEWADADLSALEMLNVGSTIVPEPLIRAWQDRGIIVVQTYGATETGPVAIHTTRHDPPEKASTAGKPSLHCEIRLVDETGTDVPQGEAGEVLIRGPNIMKEYWNDPAGTEAALENGWFHSGDIAYLDADGYYVVIDRKKDMIISGGENIYPAELEAVLYEHDEIAEAAVVGRPDERWGEVPVAYVALKKGSSMTCDEILALFADRLAKYKHPKDAVIIEALPRNAMGKIVKYELREQAAS